MSGHAHSGHISEKQEGAETSAVIATYDTHSEAEEAVRQLEEAGFDMQKLSIVGKDYYREDEVVGYYTMGDRVKAWGKTGAFWGGIWGLLFGSAFFLVPGVGLIAAAGPVVAWLVGALETAAVVGGGSALAAALYSVGIPEKDVIEYESQIKAGKYLVIAHGSPADVDSAKSALAPTKHAGMKEHACCAM